jgi:oligoribonuclease NrnB/cAMP/cGMP phosphodiesterase (DHH superfamily)
MAKKYVLHHYPCMDGLGAKYAAWVKYKESATYLPVNYGDPLPEIEDGSDVFILDFSYPKEILRDLNTRSNSLLVLDHHISAQRELEGEPYAVFDMKKSGAVLAWEHFHPGVEVPMLLQHIQDRDLWNWDLLGTHEILSGLALEEDISNPTDVSGWGNLCECLEPLWESGGNISIYQDKQVFKATQKDKVKHITIFGYKAIVINTTTLPSEIGNRLCELYDIDLAITWHVDSLGKVRLSLRADGRVDVSEIAKRLGGGGHKNASGAVTNLNFLMSVYESGTIS